MTNSKIKLIAILMFPIVIQSAAINYDQQLLDAAKTCKLDQVKEALSNGAAIDARDINQCTPLHWAAINGHTEVVNALISAKATIDARSNDQYTPLHFAAISGCTEIVNTLIKAKATIDARNNVQWTPLHCAARHGNTEIVNALLDVGANATLLDKDNKTVFHLITGSWLNQNKKEQLEKIIIDHQAYQALMLKEVPKLFVEQRDQFNIPEPIAKLITQYAFGICETEKNNKGDNNDKL